MLLNSNTKASQDFIGKKTENIINMEGGDNIKDIIHDATMIKEGPIALVLDEDIKTTTACLDLDIDLKDVHCDDEVHKLKQSEGRITDTKAATSRSKSPTIAELKALARRNPSEFIFDEQLQENECKKILSETNAQCSARSNKIIPARLKSQHRPLHQKSKSTHILKSQQNVSSAKNNQTEVCPPTQQKHEKPKDALMKAFEQVDSTNWEVGIVGIHQMVNLMEKHTNNLESHMHVLCIRLSRSVRNLRSQVARAACQAACKLFTIKNKLLEKECDELVSALLQRSVDTNRFIRADSIQAVESMCSNLSAVKVLTILTAKGALHSNASVRTTTANLLNRLVARIGCEKVYSLPRELRDKLFVTGAKLLQEGSLDTRTYAKSIFQQLAGHANYKRLISEVIPQPTYRNVEKTLRSLTH